MTEAQWIGLMCLLGFGFIFNAIVDAIHTRGGLSFIAALVIFAVLVTLFVLYLDSHDLTYTGAVWVGITLLHFAASGLGMTLGSWQRR